MKLFMPIACVLAAAAPLPALGQVAIDTIGGTDLTFEGLVQADANWYDNDVADLDGDATDGDDADYQLRTAQIFL